MSGQALAFSESDLQATVAAYDPAKHEAPLVVGHPTHDMPAYGWVQRLQCAEAGLLAVPQQVNPEFAEMVQAGAFKKISASFYAPTAPGNPVPGVYYLRHVGFLGAQAPAIKGLATPQLASFAEAEEGVITFSEWEDVTVAGLFRRLREWLIGKHGAEEADRVLPQYEVQSLEQSARDELRQEQSEAVEAVEAAPAFAQAPAPAPTPTPTAPLENLATSEEKARLEQENQRLRAQLASQQQAQQHAANVAFCENLQAQGRLLPAYQEVVLATLDHFAAQAAPLEFGEGEARAPLAEGFKKLLAELPVQVQFGEAATAARAAAGQPMGVVDFAAPDGYAVDASSAALLRKARAWQAQHGGELSQALAAVQP